MNSMSDNPGSANTPDTNERTTATADSESAARSAKGSPTDPALSSPHTVPEGDLPPGVHPEPGRRRHFRHIWTGSQETSTTEEVILKNQSDSSRITGLDAARGFALIGMVAIHTLPTWSPQNYQPTLSWNLFAGHAAALFAVLAGVTLALLSGGATPHTGAKLRRDRVHIAVRAVLIVLIGMTINFMDIPAYNILQYYGLMFLLAIPFLRLRIRHLLLAALLTVILGPLAVFFANLALDYQVIYNADLSAVFIAPVETLVTVVFSGTYPAVTWMGFIFLGMALGRMKLSEMKVQVRLGAAGVVTAVIGVVSADTLLNFLGGWDRLLLQTPGLTGAELFDILDYGPPDDSHMPTTTLWWLTVNAPHADTFFSMISSAGLAMVAISAFLLLAQLNHGLLQPLISAGSMTFTLYVAHLILLTAVDTTVFPGLWFALQIIVMLVFAYFWSHAQPRGPMESLISWATKAAGRKLINTAATDSAVTATKEPQQAT